VPDRIGFHRLSTHLCEEITGAFSKVENQI